MYNLFFRGHIKICFICHKKNVLGRIVYLPFFYKKCLQNDGQQNCKYRSDKIEPKKTDNIQIIDIKNSELANYRCPKNSFCFNIFN